MSSDTKLSADLPKILNDLDQADAEARRIIGSLNDQQLNWHPVPGAWSVAQCLNHLAQINKIYVAALRDAVHKTSPGSRSGGGPIMPGFFSRWFIQVMEPPPKRKLKAPKKVTLLPPKSGPELLPAFLAAHDEIRALVEESREIDLNRIRFVNPFVPLIRFTVGTGLMVVNAHDRRHLWQAQQVMEAMKQGRSAVAQVQ